MATTDDFIADQLAQDKSPAQIEAALIGRGMKAGAAHEAVEDALEEQLERYRKAANWDLLIGVPLAALSLIAMLFILHLTFTAEEITGRILRAHVAAWLALGGGIAELIRGYRNLRHVRRLNETRDHWLKHRAPVAQLVEAKPAAPTSSAVTAAPTAKLVSPRPPSKEDAPPLMLREAPASSAGLPPWVILAGVGAIGFIMLVALLIGLLVRNTTRVAFDQVQGPQNGREIDLNIPVPNEGPPPAGWVTLFRADDPAVWNTDSPGPNFAIPLHRAHSTIRFLRLKRMDTGEMLIMPISRKQLASAERPARGEGHWWNGTARAEHGARHLGIVQVPSAPDSQVGLIVLILADGTSYPGSGFGWKAHVDDRQYYCWLGKEIPRTAFEIAVTASALTEEEKQRYVGADDGPAPKGWTVLFRSDDPAVWNSFSPGEKFAIPIGRAHTAIRYLRLKRMDTDDSLIMPMTRSDLGGEPRPVPVKQWSWNGSAKPEYGGGHLGMIDGIRLVWPRLPHGDISIMNDGLDGFHGSGFGHKINAAGKQHYSWLGKEIARTAFEIAFTADELTEDESRRLRK